MRTVLVLVFLGVASFFGYMIYKSIQDPIDYLKLHGERYDATVERLNEIKKAEVAYKDAYGKYTSSFDSLINFVEHDSLTRVRSIGELTDEMIEKGITEEKAVKEGIIIREEFKVSVKEEIFEKGFDAKQLRYVPFTDKEFMLRDSVLKSAAFQDIPVFEARVHNNTMLTGLEDRYEQLIINTNEEMRVNKKYPGLFVGSVDEINNNAGSWEN
ncbi:MAG: hypothetical protein ACK5L5_06340 [Bacteroidales bacterium]